MTQSICGMKMLVSETPEKPIVADIPMPADKSAKMRPKFARLAVQCGISIEGTNWYNPLQIGTGVPFSLRCGTNQIVQLRDKSRSTAAISIAIGCLALTRAGRLGVETSQFLGTPPA